MQKARGAPARLELFSSQGGESVFCHCQMQWMQLFIYVNDNDILHWVCAVQDDDDVATSNWQQLQLMCSRRTSRLSMPVEVEVEVWSFFVCWARLP